MASCFVASAPRAAADSRRPIFVVPCFRWFQERRMISRVEGTACSTPLRTDEGLGSISLGCRRGHGWPGRETRAAARRAERAGELHRGASFCDLCLLPQRVSSVFYDALTLMRHIELRVLFEFSTTLDTE